MILYEKRIMVYYGKIPMILKYEKKEWLVKEKYISADERQIRACGEVY